MAQKLPACDPCRSLKLACDHSRPCARCLERGRETRCVYRPKPFKRSNTKAQRHNPIPGSGRSRSCSIAEILPTPSNSVVAEPAAPQVRYPNPGYLGSSSHTILFNHLRKENGEPVTPDSEEGVQAASPCLDTPIDKNLVGVGTQLLKDLTCLPNLPSYFELVQIWIAKGANMGLVEPLTQMCIQNTRAVLSTLLEHPETAMGISKRLFAQSSLPMSTDPTSTLEDFCNGFDESKARWETVGLFFTAACRAATDSPFVVGIYDAQQDRQNMQATAMRFSDRCLEMSLFLDRLGDFQLFLQYENFICHSQIDGDQSYRSWRKLGDVASSLFALGYHQKTDGDNCPAFLKRLRQVAFGRCYSADRNVSIFLGRPARIQRKSCKTHVYLSQDIGGTSEDWHSAERCNFITDTRWAVICANLKEDITGLSSEADYNHRAHQASIIQAEADLQWTKLPQCYRSGSELIRSSNYRPIERDFVITAQLSYLHVQFLLRRSLLEHASQYDERLFEISTQTLSLVIDAILCRELLVNSGSSLVWKVAYFGLAAAGIICLCLINRSSATMPSSVETSLVVQNLSTLVAEIERGTLISSQHPNYALLTGATKTIDSLLKRLIGSSTAAVSIYDCQQSSSSVINQIEGLDNGGWNMQENLLDFETDFWLSLSEHPFLTS